MNRSIILLIILITVTIGVILATGLEEEQVTIISIEDRMPDLVTRGAGEAYTNPIIIKGNDTHKILLKTWLMNKKRLPLVFKLISPEGNVKMTVADRQKDNRLFTFVMNSLCKKNGYNLKVMDQLNRVLVNSKLIVYCPKGMFF